MSRLRSIGLFGAGAALSAALLITGTQTWQVGAAPGDTDATYQPLSPCRLIDTRVDSSVGVREAPIGPAETYTAQVTGTNGNCADIPAGATGVAMNVTVLNATAPSNLRVFPADLADTPLVSNLNYSNTSPPTPNKVDSKLSPDGKINIFNAFGSVDVIVDVVGVYTTTSLVEIQQRLVALEAANVVLKERISDQRPTTQSIVAAERSFTTEWTNVLQLRTPIDRTGRMVVFASGTAAEITAGHGVQCVITNTPTSVVADRTMMWEASGATFGDSAGQGDQAVLAGSRSFDVTGGTSERFALMCRTIGEGGSKLRGAQMTTIFIRD